MRLRAAIAALGILAAACSISGNGNGATGASPEDLVEEAAIDPGIARVISDVERFWAEVAGELDLAYEPIDPGRVFTRSRLEDDASAEQCTFLGDARVLDPEGVIENAYVTFCDEGLSVVYDDIDLVPNVEQKFGRAGLAMLMAHEWGHVVQDQLGLFGQDGLLAEQQADCYSGAFAAWAVANDVEPFTDPAALDLAIISTLETRDQIGTSPDGTSHGNGFDRVRATREGFESGVTFCSGYDESPPTITQMAFGDVFDRANDGNLRFERADELLGAEVAAYFESLTAESLEAIVDLPERGLLRELYDAIGDNAVGTEYAMRYAEAFQAAEGFETDGLEASLQRACLVGSWLFEVMAAGDGDAVSPLSPFDLDESILTLATSSDLLANPGLVFEMVAALQVGVLEGLDACEI